MALNSSASYILLQTRLKLLLKGVKCCCKEDIRSEVFVCETVKWMVCVKAVVVKCTTYAIIYGVIFLCRGRGLREGIGIVRGGVARLYLSLLIGLHTSDILSINVFNRSYFGICERKLHFKVTARQ